MIAELVYRTKGVLMRRIILPAAAILSTAACSNVTVAAPAPTITVTHAVSAAPSSRPASIAPASPSPAATTPAAAPPPAPHLTNASAVVTQYYQDITDHDYAAAWALGGSNIAGTTYGQWVAGFATTENITLNSVSDFGSSQVRAGLYATQTDGTVNVYEGTYTVSGGVLVGASIRQVG